MNLRSSHETQLVGVGVEGGMDRGVNLRVHLSLLRDLPSGAVSYPHGLIVSLPQFLR